MNTKTMRLPPRRVVTSSTNKRKEREGSPLTPQPPHPAPAPPPKPSSQLLAGYLAHEFLTRGTLLGHPWGAEAGNETKRAKTSEEESRRRYVEVSSLVRGGEGAYLPGVINPTQLARFLQ